MLDIYPRLKAGDSSYEAISPTARMFLAAVNRIHPRFGDNMMLDFNQPAD